MNESDVKRILSKKGYGLKSTLGGGVSAGLKIQKTLDKTDREREVSELESGAGLKSIRPKELATPHSGRCVVRVKVFRRRLTDTGNDCWKYHLDACRYLGWLADDDDATIRLEEEPHEKVETNEEERVEITLEYDGVDLNDLIEYYKDGPKNQP